MAKLYPFRNSFSSGELSPLMYGRSDHPRYQNGAQTLLNWIVLPQGGITRRHGTVKVAEVKQHSHRTWLLPFEAEDAINTPDDEGYIIEAGNEYFRFYSNGARLEVAAVPVEVETPYPQTAIPDVRTAQANDLLLLVRFNQPPQRLTRLTTDGLSWDMREIRFDPPPTYEAGQAPDASITPGGMTGVITIAASANVFLETDIGRQIEAGIARAVITDLNAANNVDARVLDAFTSLAPIAAGDWRLRGSPNAELKPSGKEPVGSLITLDLQLAQADEPELVSNGTFATNTDWDDRSGPLITSGTHTGANNSANLVDATKNFPALGVLNTHIVTNTTDGSAGVANIVTTTTITLDPVLSAGSENDFDTGDAYTITGTGTAVIGGGELKLHGGTAGIGWREQEIPTVAGRRYRLTWHNRGWPASLQIGSASMASDILPEATYPVNTLANPEHTAVFTALGVSTWIGYRNNQDTLAVVDDVSCKLFSAEGWRADDDGLYVYLNGGLVRIRSITDATKAVGEILVALTTDEAAAPGAWQLESPAWTGALGFPSTVMLMDGRLDFAGTRTFPQHIWLSEVDGLFNFARGAQPDDAVILSITQAGGNITRNRIRWLLPADRFLVGTTHAEYALMGANNDAITPTSLPTVRRGSMLGTTRLAPLLTSRSVLLLQRGGSKIWELQFNPQSEKFDARDLTILSGHLLEDAATIDQWVYAPEPVPIIWAVRDDGTLLGLTYDLAENITGWFRVTTQGWFESIAAIKHPTANATQVWCVVRRSINGAFKRYVEYFEIFLPEEPHTGQTGCFLDCATIVTLEAATDILDGLGYLEGESIEITANGGSLGRFTVEDGAVTLEEELPAGTVVVAGLPYTDEAMPLPPDLPQAGTIRTRKKRVQQANVLLHETVGLRIDGKPLGDIQSGAVSGQGPVVFSGWKQMTTYGYNQDGQVRFSVNGPYPATILAYTGVLDVDLEA